MDYHKITVRQYADLLESRGYLLLGEPNVYYAIANGIEEVKLYLTTDKHSTQLSLFEGTLNSDPSAVRRLLFLENKTTNNYSLSQFVKKYGSREIFIEEPLDLKSKSVLLGRSSLTKCLTLFLAQKILAQDMQNSEAFRRGNIPQPDPVFLLKRAYDAIARPENVAYLARLSYFDAEEKLDFISFPFGYLARSFPVPGEYDQITVPTQTLEYAKFPYERKSLINA